MTDLTLREIDERKRVSAHVAQQLLEAIHSGAYRPGDRLPPERALAEQMQVSRNSIREALSALELSGWIEARVGSGTYVLQKPNSQPDLDDVLAAVDVGFDVIEIWEAERELDSVIIGLAADRATSRDIERLAEILEEMRQAADQEDVERVLSLGQRFHRTFAVAAGNAPLRAALAAIGRTSAEEYARRVALDAVAKGLRVVTEAHAAMLLAIRLRDRLAAVDAVRRFYRVFLSYLDDELLHRKASTPPGANKAGR